MTSSHTATDLMDISLTPGDLVAVLKELDPMGNTDRWFVDNGGERKCDIFLKFYVEKR